MGESSLTSGLNMRCRKRNCYNRNNEILSLGDSRFGGGVTGKLFRVWLIEIPVKVKVKANGIRRHPAAGELIHFPPLLLEFGTFIDLSTSPSGSVTQCS